MASAKNKRGGKKLSTFSTQALTEEQTKARPKAKAKLKKERDKRGRNR